MRLIATRKIPVIRASGTGNLRKGGLSPAARATSP